MNSSFKKVLVMIVAILVFIVTFVGSSREQVIVEANKVATDSNNINNDYLVGPKWLSQNIDDGNIVILDIRSKKLYEEGHVPGAINVSWSSFINESMANNSNQQLSDWRNLINKKVLSKELQNLGITENKTVIIYGQSNTQSCTELGDFSWLFNSIGIKTKMLNGGYDNWIANGLNSIKGVPLPKKSNIQIENLVPVKPVTSEYIEKNISKVKFIQFVNNLAPKKTADAVLNNSSNTNSNNQNSSNNNNNSSSNNSSSDNNSNNSNSNNSNSNNANNTNNQQTNALNSVIKINLDELLNPNGTIKPVNYLDNLFENKGLNPNDVIMLTNTSNGNIEFMKLILNMAGYDNVLEYNLSNAQVFRIDSAIQTKKSDSNNNSSNSSGQNSNANSNNSSSNNATDNNSNSNSNSTSTNNNNSSSSNSQGQSDANANNQNLLAA